MRALNSKSLDVRTGGRWRELLSMVPTVGYLVFFWVWLRLFLVQFNLILGLLCRKDGG